MPRDRNELGEPARFRVDSVLDVLGGPVLLLQKATPIADDPDRYSADVNILDIPEAMNLAGDLIGETIALSLPRDRPPAEEEIRRLLVTLMPTIAERVLMVVAGDMLERRAAKMQAAGAAEINPPRPLLEVRAGGGESSAPRAPTLAVVRSGEEV